MKVQKKFSATLAWMFKMFVSALAVLILGGFTLLQPLDAPHSRPDNIVEAHGVFD